MPVLGAAALLAGSAWLAVRVIVPLGSFRGRRLLLSSWRRRTRWEFWPCWAVYLPLVPWLVLCAIRHRGLTTCTAANPAIPAGGFVGESKAQILGLIGDRRVVARYELLPAALDADGRMERVRRFMRREDLDFPVVLKPDQGQRGLGVAIIRNEEHLRAYCATPRPDTLVQEYVDGPEFGVFYCRHPGEPRGRILSLTEKQFTAVVGDGQSTLERLILNDARAVCSARKFLHKHHAHLHTVPPAGQTVPLTDIGNHARGTVFLDGTRLLTPELEAAFDRIGQSFAGFFFGRLDVRAASEEDFRQGRNIRIMEANGITSEATHIYDPKHRFWYAQRVLREQWRMAYEIGAANRARGCRPMPITELLRLILAYKPAREA